MVLIDLRKERRRSDPSVVDDDIEREGSRRAPFLNFGDDL